MKITDHEKSMVLAYRQYEAALKTWCDAKTWENAESVNRALAWLHVCTTPPGMEDTELQWNGDMEMQEQVAEAEREAGWSKAP